MAEAEFESVEPFDIDNGELDGLDPQKCFVLGVEWQMVAAQVSSPDAFDRPIHVENRERLAALLDRRGRQYRFEYMADDPSESWMWLQVAEDS